MPENGGAQTRGKRIHLMDELRGFAVFCMIFFHGFYTAGFLFGNWLGLWLFRFFPPAEPFFAGLFLFISGVSSNLSHSNLARGLKLLAVALGVTLVTFVFLPQDVITFGVLHFLSVCMIGFGLLPRPAVRRPFSWFPAAVCAVLFFLTKGVPRGYLGAGPRLGVPLPRALYASGWLSPLGFPGGAFQSADYFPLLPWVFVFAAGTFFGRLAAAGKFPEAVCRSRVPALSWLGRHALVLYLAHQPVIYGLGLLFAWISRAVS